MKHIVILGEGISGISTAFYLLKNQRHHLKVTIIDKSRHAGGWLKSLSYQDQLVLEFGPRTIRTYGSNATNTLKLIETLNLQTAITGVKSNDPKASNRYIYYNKFLHKLPTNIYSLFQKNTLTTKPLAYYLLREPLFSLKHKRSKNYYDSSIYEFMSSRFGLELSDLLIDPLCKGIFAGDSKSLSIKSCFPQIYDSTKSHGSVVLGNLFSSNINKYPIESSFISKIKQQKWTMWYMKDGLGTLPKLILKQLTLFGDKFQRYPEEGCFELTFMPGKLKVKTNKREILCDHVVAALPSYALAKLFDYAIPQDLHQQPSNLVQPAVYQAMIGELSKINFVDVAVVNLVYSLETRADFEKLPRGFGYLVPTLEGIPLLGTIFDWCINVGPSDPNTYPKLINLTCMIGGAWMEHYFGQVDGRNESLFSNCAIKYVREHLGIVSDPVHCVVTYSQKCIPQYAVGHDRVVDRLEKIIETNNLPLTLVGASYKGISINDCIYNAKIASEQIIEQLS